MTTATAVVEIDDRDRIRYRVLDGHEAGIAFLAADARDWFRDWLIGETVTVTYHPDDQYARRA